MKTKLLKKLRKNLGLWRNIENNKYIISYRGETVIEAFYFSNAIYFYHKDMICLNANKKLRKKLKQRELKRKRNKNYNFKYQKIL